MEKTAVNVHSRVGWSWPVFGGLLLIQLWAAHAFAFFLHEYAHSFTAWLLGWKSNPLALYYAHPTLVMFLAQLGINQDVNETPRRCALEMPRDGKHGKPKTAFRPSHSSLKSFRVNWFPTTISIRAISKAPPCWK